MPSISFAYAPGRTFFLGLRGPGDTFYAINQSGIDQVAEDGQLVSGFASPFLDGTAITAASWDRSKNQLYVAGLLILKDGLRSVVKLNQNGSVAADFNSVMLTNTVADDAEDAAYVSCIVPDGTGGCYVGGPFNVAAGTPSTGLVHIDGMGACKTLNRPSAATESPMSILAMSDGIIVVQATQIFKILAGGQVMPLVQGGGWISVKAVDCEANYGIAILGQTEGGAKCFEYGLDGIPSKTFHSSVTFVGFPTALRWDQSGNLLVATVQATSISGDQRGMKRLLPDGTLDPTWSHILSFDGIATGMAMMDHSIILSGSFNQIDGIRSQFGVCLSSESTVGQMANQSVLGKVGGGQNLVFGVTIKGSFMVEALLRASGPSLSQFGISPTPTNTVLSLYHGANLVQQFAPTQNAEAGIIKSATTAVGAFPLTAGGLNEAEGLVGLAPGAYTVVVDSASGGQGQALGEIYYP